jgi:hypothetical protein
VTRLLAACLSALALAACGALEPGAAGDSTPGPTEAAPPVDTTPVCDGAGGGGISAEEGDLMEAGLWVIDDDPVCIDPGAEVEPPPRLEPSCEPGDVVLGLTEEAEDERGPLFVAAVRNAGGALCYFHGTVSVSVARADGPAAPGLPEPRSDSVVNYPLEPGTAWRTGYRWVNWCGPEAGFAVQAATEDEAIALGEIPVPPCALERAPSVLDYEPAPGSGP